MTISNAYPDILMNGTAADATQVMADFYQIQNDVNANAAHNGANSDITSLTGLTTPLATAYGGTGVTSYAALFTALGAAPIASPSFTGGITVAGGIATDTLTSTGNITVGGALAVTGNSALTGTLTVTGATSLQAATGLTRTSSDNSTHLATTAYADAQAAAFATASGNQTLAASGYQKLPGGLILQWGTCPNSISATVMFPITFPNAVLGIQATPNDGTNGSARLNTVNNSSFSWGPVNAATPAFYFAYGY